MNIAYIRVSTTEQNVARQYELLKDHNIEKFFEEKISGKNTDRPQLNEMLQFIRQNDTLYIESFSRLARSTKDLLTIVDTLTKKGANFVSLKENIDTTTPAGRFMLVVFAALAEFELTTLKERQREGINIALAEGRLMGRPRINNVREDIYRKWRAGKVTASEAMRLCNMKPNTWYRRAKEREATTIERGAQ